MKKSFSQQPSQSSPTTPLGNVLYQEKLVMKRFQSTLCATLLTVVLASTAFAGTITTLKPGSITTLKPGSITTLKPGSITTLKPGSITTLSAVEYISILLATLIG